MGCLLCVALPGLRPRTCSGSWEGDRKHGYRGRGVAGQGEAHLMCPQMPLEASVTWLSLTAGEATAHHHSIILGGGDTDFVGHLIICAIEVNKELRSCRPHF